MTTTDTVERLLSKSKEAFVLAVELYNRPTLTYHAESCSIFLCNAWELMLKAHLVKTQGLDAIYYKDESGRTLSLTDCLRSVFTNDKDPLRINMQEVVNFRNTNTHFITDEYEIFYGPFLQAAVENYADKLSELHGESVSDLMPENHLSLSVRRGNIDPDVVRTKYEPRVAAKLLAQNHSAVQAAGQEGNGKIAAIYETNFRLVKKASDADLNVYVDNNAESGIAIVKDIKDPASYYPFTFKACIDEVNKRLKKKKAKISYRGEEKAKFNSHDLQIFLNVYQMKGNQKFSYDRKASNENHSSWIYSQRAVQFIADTLIKDPHHCLDKLKAKLNGQ